MANYANYLAERDYFKGPGYANVFVGGVATAQLDMVEIGAVLRRIWVPGRFIVSLAGIGKSQLQANFLGIAMEAGVRTGLEDYPVDEDALAQEDNLYRVDRIIKLACLANRRIMSPDFFRRLMKLRREPGQYGRAW